MKFVGTLWRNRFLEFKCQEVGRPYVVPWHLSYDDGSAGSDAAPVTVVTGVPYATCLYNTRIASAHHPRQNLRRVTIHPKAGRILLHPRSGEKIFTELESGVAVKSLVTNSQEPFSLAAFALGEILIIHASVRDAKHYEDVELLEHWVPREESPQRIPAMSAKAAVIASRVHSG